MPETPSPNPGSDFLKQKYDLHNKPEVESAARRTEIRTGEAVPDDAAERIQNYLDRFTDILNRDDPDKRERGLEALRRLFNDKFVIKPSDIPQGYYDLQGRLVEERGQRTELEQSGVRIEAYTDTKGQTKKHYHYPDRLKQELNTAVITDQASSLNLWLDYLTSSDATYPNWLKYYAMRGVLSLGGFDKEKRQFEQRRIDTVKTFPDLNREALAYVLDALEKKYGVEYFELREQLAANTRAFHLLERYESKRQIVDSATVQEPITLSAKATVLSIALPGGKTVRMKRRDLEQLQSELPSTPPFDRSELASTQLAVTQELSQLLADRQLPESFQGQLEEDDFGKLYTWALEKVTPASEEALSNTQGEWVKFDRGMDPMTDIPEGFDRPLVPSLQGHGTGWCTAGESTAKYQLEKGDFHVYYTYDKQGKPTIPRIAIRMQDGKIAEVRGIKADQELEDNMVEQDKAGKYMEEAHLQGKEAYVQKTSDMKRLTAIEKKAKGHQQLDSADLTFLYELDHQIQGFGYQKDPRIADLREGRNLEQDQEVIFGCEGHPEWIARTVDAINSDTKAYVGTIAEQELDPETGKSRLKPEYRDIFQKFFQFNIEHIYIKFPEGKIQRYNIEVGGKDATQLTDELEASNIFISDYTKDLLLETGKEGFEASRLKQSEPVKLIQVRLADLGFQGYVTVAEIFGTEHDMDEQGNPAPFSRGIMTALGLDFCSPDTGPALRLRSNDPTSKLIAMLPIRDRLGSPFVFRLVEDAGRLELSADGARSDREWGGYDRVVFRLRK